MHDEEPRRVVDEALVRLLRGLGDHLRIGALGERLEGLVEDVVLPLLEVKAVGREVRRREVARHHAGVGRGRGDVEAHGALQVRAIRLRARLIQQHLPLDDVEFDRDAAGFLQVLLQELVHRQRQHLAGAGARDHDLEGQRVGGGVAAFGEQRLALGRIELVGVGRAAEVGVGLLEPADGRLGGAVEHSDEALAVDAVVEALAHLHVLEGARLCADVEEPRPHVRIGSRRDDEARRLERRDAIGGRHLDPVDLA